MQLQDRHAAIIGISGQSLTEAERGLLCACPPAGVILFGRNIGNPAQLAELVGALRAVLPGDAVLMVDQEGGRVARLRPPGWRSHPSAAAIGALHGRDQAAGLRAAWLTGALIGLDCAQAGFDVVCAPVLDRAVEGANAVIGDRAYASDTHGIVRLAGAMADGLLAAGVQPVGKHVPGHGRALLDSHMALPELDGIEEADLAPFAELRWLPWWMTAHIRYRGADPEHPATLSAAILQDTVRGRLGFGNLLVSDDLSMHALDGSAGSRAARALAAGCDIALHCSGLIGESQAVLQHAGWLGAAARLRLERARALALGRRQSLDADSLAAERDALL